MKAKANDEIQIRVIDKRPCTWHDPPVPEDYTLPHDVVALISADRDMVIFGCGPYRGQVCQHNSRKWSFHVWHVIGFRTVVQDIEVGKKRAVSQCVAGIAIAAGLLKI